MEHQLWKAILILLKQASKRRRCTRERYGADDIVQVWLWAVLHGRPVSWACDLRNWPLHERRRKLPSSSTMSRRLRSAEVQQMLQEIERSELAPRGNKPLYWMIDGKPLPIGGCSKDRQAGYGRAAGCKAKGYKLHAVVGSDGSIAAWRVAPMQKDERAMGRRMLKQAAVQGYLLADAATRTSYTTSASNAACNWWHLRVTDLAVAVAIGVRVPLGCDLLNCSRIRKARSAVPSIKNVTRSNATSDT